MRNDSREQDENACATGVKALYDRYTKKGYEVIVVIEEYINYSYNMAAVGFNKNRTSELIGKIKFALNGVNVIEQKTSTIKTKYGNKTLIELGILEKDGRSYVMTKDFSSKKVSFSRHVRDALRHYLLFRDSKGMFNYVKE